MRTLKAIRPCWTVHPVLILALAAALAFAGTVARAAAEVPASLTDSDWASLRGQIEASRYRAAELHPLTIGLPVQQAYLKASDTGINAQFGYSVAISGDTVVVGARFGSNETGAAYVFVRSGSTWSQQAELIASNADVGDGFGSSVAISGDTVVVGAPVEASNAKGVNGNQADNSARQAGAAYVFVRSGTTWSQQAYLKASNTEEVDSFGWSVAISGDTVIIGAVLEDSDATGVNGDQTDNSATDSGAAYVFVRSGTTWSQQAYLKASNTGAGDQFGWSVAIFGDTVVVGALNESSDATGVNGDQTNDFAFLSGAAYVFVRSGTTWSQQAYLKASNTDAVDRFGVSVAIFGDTVVVGALFEASSATGVNGDQTDNSAPNSGAAYVFVRSASTWSQQAYLKASNTGTGDELGWSVAIFGDMVVVGALFEASNATGVDGNQTDNSAPSSGAAYVFVRSGTTWSQQTYLKASNTGIGDNFGQSVAITWDTAIVGAWLEDSNATGVNGNQADDSTHDAGAVYVFNFPQADLGITVDDGATTATPGGTVTYTIIASNAGPDIDPAVTVTDTFPPALSGCSITSVAAGGATGNDPGPTAGPLADSGISLPPGSSVTYTATCTLGTSPGPTLANTATVTGSVSDPNATNNSATDTDAVGASLTATKTASGAPYVVGGTVTYTIVLTNGGGDQADNPGPELVDVLPPGLALVSASASSGTLVSDVPTNSVTWNGGIPAGGTVTIIIQATILPGAVGKTLANQASIAFDANGDGTNEAAGVTDDPTVAGGPDATLIQVARQSVVEIPTLGPVGLALLLLALATAALLVLRRRAGGVVMLFAALLFTLTGFAAGPAAALTPYLVRDINLVPEPESSDPQEMTALGGLAVFSAFEGTVGREPWVSDGTAAGTFLLADTCPGPCSGSPRDFVLTGEGRAFFQADGALWVTRGTPVSTFRLIDSASTLHPSVVDLGIWSPAQRRLFFTADDGVHGVELWTSDGTAVGTFQVADLLPGAGSSAPASFALFQNKVFFSAAAGSDRGLWVSDGTAGGTRLVKGGSSGAASLHNPGRLQPLANVLVFLASSPAGGYELWRSDGTARGTVPLFEIEPGAASPSIGSFTVLGKRLLFPAWDRKRGSELWATDGTPGGTRPLTNLPARGRLIGEGTPRFSLGARTVFLADDGVHGAEPWVTDGTPAGTRMLADVCPGACSSVGGDLSLDTATVRLGSRLFLPLTDARGHELWSTDGTAACTRLVKDICPGACGSQPQVFGAVQGRVFFIAADGQSGVELWATDGTAGGTVRLTDFADDHPFSFSGSDYIESAALPTAFLFAADDSQHGHELWRSDATAAGTGLVVDLAHRDLGGSFPCALAAANGRLWFAANDGEHGYQLWTSDGTSAGTRSVYEGLPPSSQCPLLPGTVEAGGKTFLLFGDSSPRSLWVSDGTPSGTLALTDESSLRIDSGLFPVGSHVLFFSSEEVLWSSDGTIAGTVPVKNLTPDSTSALIQDETIFNGRLFFSARGDSDGRELWTSDGTAAGTFVVADLVPGGSNPQGLAVFGGKLYFFADTVPGGLVQLWSSDGTAAGTQIALDLESERPPIAAGDRMYLFAAAPDAAPGLWVSDGTAAGTRFLDAVMPAPNNGEIPPVAVGGRLFFAGPGATSEVSRLWTSDGTVEGTRPVRDRDGNELLNPVTLRAFAGRLVVGTLIGGNETLWESNGTDAGTLAILTLPSNPQWPQNGSRTELAVAGDRLFFSAYDSTSGTELWALAP